MIINKEYIKTLFKSLFKSFLNSFSSIFKKIFSNLNKTKTLDSSTSSTSTSSSTSSSTTSSSSISPVDDTNRVSSIDALRGFNMLLIIGLIGVLSSIGSMTIEDFKALGPIPDWYQSILNWMFSTHSFSWLKEEMQHVSWHGITHNDTILPAFLLIAGICFPFSLARSIKLNLSKKQIIIKILTRTFLLVLVGIIYNNNVNFNLHHLRYMGILQRIGLAWMVASLIYLFFYQKIKTLLSILIFILISYWFVICLVPAPDVAEASGFSFSSYKDRFISMFQPRKIPLFTLYPLIDPQDPDYPQVGSVDHNLLPEGSVVNWIDRKFLPGHLFWDINNQRDSIKESGYDPKIFRTLRDNEGFGSTYPAIATVLLGILIGCLLRSKNPKLTKPKKATLLFTISILLLEIGYLWNIIFPINKNLWTSSFVCFSGGFVLLNFSLFYWIMDVCGYKKWAFPLKIIGMNAIAILLATKLINFTNLTNALFFDLINRWVPHTKNIVLDNSQVSSFTTQVFVEASWNLAHILVCLMILLFLYRKKIFFKI